MAAAIKNMNSALPDPDIKQTNPRGHGYQTTVCPAEYALYHVCCCLRMEIIWHAALNSSHHCCHHSVSIVRSRLMAEK